MKSCSSVESMGRCRYCWKRCWDSGTQGINANVDDSLSIWLLHKSRAQLLKCPGLKPCFINCVGQTWDRLCMWCDVSISRKKI